LESFLSDTTYGGFEIHNAGKGKNEPLDCQYPLCTTNEFFGDNDVFLRDFSNKQRTKTNLCEFFNHFDNLFYGYLTFIFGKTAMWVNENVNPDQAQQITSEVFRRFDPDFVLNPIWCKDVYKDKFKEIKTQTRIILIGSAISIFIAMLGLLAIHLFSTVRRTKEIGIRRILGAEKWFIFTLLSLDILKWIGFAALFAIPIAVYFVSEMLSNYANHIHINWIIFILPVLAQSFIALLTTSGVSIGILSQNPVKSLKPE